jgi:hypothetical protein
MNNQEKYKEDLLRQYIDPEMTEEAPGGFTSKVMTQIQLESRPFRATHKLREKSFVPLISASVTVLLIASAFLIPGNDSDSLTSLLLNLLKSLKLSVPEIDLSSIFRVALPSVLMYVILGILILTVFDRALYRIFHREKQ